MTQEIEVSRDGAVQVIRFNRPGKKNAITNDMYHALVDALVAGEADDSVHVHLLLGHPGVFTAGNDVGDFLKLAQSGDLATTGVGRYLTLQPDIAKPLLAAVDGLAVGIGTTLLFHCDMVFATERSRFMTPFVDLGLVAENASSLMAPRLMGPQRAFEMLALGEGFTAARAEASGLVNAILSETALEPHAMEVARRLAAKPRNALRQTKALLKGDSAEIHAASRRESALFAECLTSDETIQAVMAFMAR